MTLRNLHAKPGERSGGAEALDQRERLLNVVLLVAVSPDPNLTGTCARNMDRQRSRWTRRSIGIALIRRSGNATIEPCVDNETRSRAVSARNRGGTLQL
jgi:hypothetical protein